MLVSRFVILSLLLNGLLSAQVPQIPGIPGIPGTGPEAEEGTPQPMNLTQELRKPDPNAAFPGELNFRNLDGFGIAGLYQNVTGKRVIVSSTAKDVQFAFVQSAGLKNREVATLIEEYLMMEGFQLNPSLRDPDIVSLLGVNQPGGPASVVRPVRVLDEPSQLALETGVVTYVMTFQYLKPEEALRAFTQVYGQFRPGGTIAEVSNASSLIITEKAELIQSLVKLKSKIDVPSAKVDTSWVMVQYADVQELADQLNEMFNAQSSQNQSARVQRQPAANTPPIPGLTGNAAGGAGGGAGEESPPTITPDSRTNRIFLMGRPVDLVFIEELIAAWDVPSDQRNFLRRKLKYLPVYSFVPVAEAAIARTLGDSSGAGGAAGGAGGSRSSSNANNSQLGSNNNNRNSNGNNGNNAAGGGRGGGNGAASLAGSDRPLEPGSVLVGNTLIVSDNVANSVIVQGPPHHVEIIEQLIDELDVKNEQVAISAVFGRYSVTDGLTFGVDVAKILNNNGIAVGSSNGAGIVGRDAINSFAGLAGGAGGLDVSGFVGNFGIFVNALETYTNFKAFARPTIFTTNNKEARISSGTQIAIPTNTFVNAVGNGGQSTNVEYRDVALELLVRPLVNDKDEITLEISISRDTVGEDRTVGELTIPDLLSDQLETIVTVPTGSAVLLGGLIEETTTENNSGIPILRSIPLIGGIFKNNDDQFIRSELVIMIRPTIVDGSVQLNQYQEVYDYGSNLSNDARKELSSPAYTPTKNSAVKRIFGNGQQAAPAQQQQPGRYPGPTPSSPMQKAIYDKKKRLDAERQKRGS